MADQRKYDEEVEVLCQQAEAAMEDVRKYKKWAEDYDMALVEARTALDVARAKDVEGRQSRGSERPPSAGAGGGGTVGASAVGPPVGGGSITGCIRSIDAAMLQQPMAKLGSMQCHQERAPVVACTPTGCSAPQGMHIGCRWHPVANVWACIPTATADGT